MPCEGHVDNTKMSMSPSLFTWALDLVFVRQPQFGERTEGSSVPAKRSKTGVRKP